MDRADQDRACGLPEAHPNRRVAPFAVNQIVHVSNDRLEHDVAVCVRHKVPITITSLRAPADVVKATHAYGGIVLHDVINVRHAMKAAEDGVDGLILVCAGAGGHAGTLSPFALLAEVRRRFPGTIALSGAIANGAGILAAQAMGADLAYIGTRFIATREANASPIQEDAGRGSASDIVYSSLFTGVHGNYWGQHCRRRAGSQEPAGRRQDQDELRVRRQQQEQGLARYLGRRSGGGKHRRRADSCRMRRAPAPGIS